MVRLYHYLEARWALDDIRRRRLKLSGIADLNDPYEFACVYSTDSFSQSVLERTREEKVEMHGITSFSRKWNDVLLWSHYGDKHKGICLGFDVTVGLTREIRYEDSVLVVGDLRAEDDLQRIVDRLEGTKYKGWSYEAEVRATAPRGAQDSETRLYFVSFDENLVLREVIAGERCTLTRPDIDQALEGYEGIKVAKVKHDPTKFEMTVDDTGFASSVSA
jgi:hypothetical protein